MQHSEGEDRGDTLTCSVASYEQSEKKREHVNNCWYSGYETEREAHLIWDQWHAGLWNEQYGMTDEHKSIQFMKCHQGFSNSNTL